MTAKKSRLFIITLSTTLAFLIAILVVGAYLLREKNQRISELNYSADRASEADELVRSIQTIQQDAKEDLETFDNLVLTGDKLVALIESIEGTGQALGLETKILSVGKTESKKPLVPDIVRIAIETNGTWSANLNFLYAIESLPHKVMIDESSQYRQEESWSSKIILTLQSFD